ncbi:MAG: right-handed parallel beta-helix repeat-containing protein [Phycisphaeraceae bacterium]|nr:right-handed parallel beta-helix repeat-containing protein [Phycisphaeraceae bacterium]
MKNNETLEFFVSPLGCDAWSGRLAEANRRGTDGPLATVEAARNAARLARKAKGFRRPVRITLRHGVHFQSSPLLLGFEDSGIARRGTITRSHDDPACPLTLSAYPGETPVLSGGRRIEGLRETTVHGVKAWVASLPDVQRGTWNFRQLWVNGQRRFPPRLPREGHYRMAGYVGTFTKDDHFHDRGKDRFIFAPDHLSSRWRNLTDVDISYPNFWLDQHVGIKQIDDRKRLAILQHPTHTRLLDDSWRPPATYRSRLGVYSVENVFEALDQPGLWYLDRPEGLLYYLPMPGEEIDTVEVIAPCLEHVVRIEGESFEDVPANERADDGMVNANCVDRHPGRAALEIRFEGITFSHTQWSRHPGHAESGIQAACDVTGAVVLRNAHTIAFHRCNITHVGGYALECAGATRDVELHHCDIRDTGAGGVKVWHRCSRTTISDCHIHDGGHVYAGGVGILVGRSSGNMILHNAVHDFGYSGMQIGWDWTDDQGDAYGNVIEYNHVYNIGKDELSDIGGIYTLGVAPGTRIRHNVVHDVRSRSGKAWGIYLDAGSSYMLIENNLIYRAGEGALMMNQNRGHVIRNNIFAFGGQYQIGRNVLVAFATCEFERNIVLSDASPFWVGNWSANRADLHHNLYFARRIRSAGFGGARNQRGGMTLGQWQKRGLDAGSLVADPKFVDAENGDFRFQRNSPAKAIGFVPFDLGAVGPRD